MSRIAWLCGLGIVAAALPVWADLPSAQPTESNGVATTAPAATATSPANVYLVPFRPLSDAASWAWAGRAIQQNLVVDLTRASYRPMPAADGEADPVAAARSAGARYVVTGTYQWVEPQLRFSGQVLDTSNSSVVGVLSATGDGQDLFSLEDELSTQLVRALTHAVGHPAKVPINRPVPPALQPDAVAAAITPAAGGVGSAYAGSALEAYVNGNRSPSVDYNQQLANVRQQNIFGSYNNYGGPYGQGYAGFGYGGFGYGGYGYGYAGYGSGGYLLGISYPVAGGGPFGNGYGGAFGRGYGGSYHGSFAGGRGSISIGIGSRGRGGIR